MNFYIVKATTNVCYAWRAQFSEAVRYARRLSDPNLRSENFQVLHCLGKSYPTQQKHVIYTTKHKFR